MPAYFETITMERFDDVLGYIDITSRCISTFEIDDIGIQSADYMDRLATPASLMFVVNNEGDYFDPNTDFKRRQKLRLRISWRGIEKIFIFYVIKATPSDTTYADETITIRATDWLGIAMLDILRQVPMQTNLTVDDAVEYLLSLTAVPPANTDFDVGTFPFPYVFDAIRNGRTTLYAELYNLILSEIGYMYLTNNETLVIDNQTARETYTPPSSTAFYEEGDTLPILVDGDELLDENDSVIYMVDVEETIFDGTFPRLADTTFSKAIEREEGENVLNKIIVQVQPRMVDLSVGALYQLYTYNLYSENPPIPVPSGQTIVLEGTYPEDGGGQGKTPDAAMDVAAPTYGTGTSIFSYSLGPGGAALLNHTFVAGATSWRWTIQNTGPSTGNIGFIELFGRPVFKQQPLSYTAEDLSSQIEHGPRSLMIDFPYRVSLPTARAKALLAQEKDSRTRILSASICANLDVASMAMFMLTDVGSVRRLISDTFDIDMYCFIQGMRIRIEVGGITYCQYKIKSVNEVS